jgi:VWFA-related protein
VRRIASTGGRLAIVSGGVVVAAALAVRVLAQAPASPPPQTPPAFRADIDVVVVEASVVDRAGKVVAGLGPADFAVEIGGQPREILSAELVEYAPATPAAKTAAPAAVDLDITTNQPDQRTPGRVVVVVVDVESLRAESRDVLQAAQRWVTSLPETDRVGLVTLPPPGPHMDPTTQHAEVVKMLATIGPRAGAAPPPFSRYTLSVYEALQIYEYNTFVRNEVILRECGAQPPPLCPAEIDMQARTLAMETQAQVQPVLNNLRALMRGLAAIPGPKHAVLLSSGWPINEREAATAMSFIASEAAKSNVTVHTFTTSQWAMAASRGRMMTTLAQDQQLLMNSVEMLANLTGGRPVRLTGSGDQAFTSLTAGLSGYYRLGVRAAAADLDGSTRKIEVKVSRPDAKLAAYRRVLASTKADEKTAPADPTAALRSALASASPMAGVDLRATSYVLQGEGAARAVRVVVTGDVSRAAAGLATTAAGLYDSAGKAVNAVESTVDIVAGGPAPVTLSLAAPPGLYVLRLAVRDADGKLGSLQRQIDARWKKVGSLETPGLVLFRTGPSTGRTTVPLFRALTTADSLIAQLAVGSSANAAAPQVLFEVLREGGGDPLLKRTGRVGQTSGGTTVVEESIPVAALPPGRYTLRATMRPFGAAPPFTRGFVVEPAPVPPAPAAGTTAAGTAVPGAPAAGSAPRYMVALAMVKPPRFTAASVLAPGFVGPALEKLAAHPGAAGVKDALTGLKPGDYPRDPLKGPLAASPVAAQFVAGLGRLEKGELDAAATAFRDALRAAPDFSPALAFLGACYATGAKDREAAGAWQMALVREPSPDLQRFAIEAWLRADRPASAASLIAQARQRWPDDASFARLQAQAAIADGRIQEGLDLVAGMKDPGQETLLAALATLYDAARRRAPVWDAARDLETTKKLREAYAAAGGESLGLVDAWIAEMAGAK